MNYEEEIAKLEKEFNEREKKESGNSVGKAQHEKTTEEIYKEALIQEAQEKAQADEVARIAGLSSEELELEYARQEQLDTPEEQRKEAGIPWFAPKKESTLKLKFS